MTRSEREHQIERYISGGMTPAEEQDFFIQAALDKELRIELKALVTVDSAIRKERDAEPSEHTALRARVAAMLVAVPPPQKPAATSPAPRATAPAAGAVQNILPIQWISFAAATIALTAVIFLLIDRLPDHNSQPTRYQQSHPEMPAIQQHAPIPAPASADRDAMAAPAATPSETAGTPHSPAASIDATSPNGTRPSEAMQNSRTQKARTETDGEAVPSEQIQKPSPSLRNERMRPQLDAPDEPIMPRKRKDDSLPVGVTIKVNPDQ